MTETNAGSELPDFGLLTFERVDCRGDEGKGGARSEGERRDVFDQEC